MSKEQTQPSTPDLVALIEGQADQCRRVIKDLESALAGARWLEERLQGLVLQRALALSEQSQTTHGANSDAGMGRVGEMFADGSEEE